MSVTETSASPQVNLPHGPLQGIRVVEWGEMVSAPYCARLLAELGAGVVKVEPPDGDPARRCGPYPDGVPHPERSGLFLFVNQGKRDVTLDTASGDGINWLDRFLETADVFVENRPYATLDRAGITADALAQRHPHLITVSLSPYGRTGDYKQYAGYDLQVNAFSSMSFGTGHVHWEPLTTRAQQAAYLAGAGGAYAAIVALLARDAGAGGQYIDFAGSGGIADAPTRWRNRRALDELIANRTRTLTPGQATKLQQAAGVDAMPVMNIADQFADSHLNACETYVEVDHPHVGAELLYGIPWRFRDTPGAVRAPAPLLGQHNDYVLSELFGRDGTHIAQLCSDEVVF